MATGFRIERPPRLPLPQPFEEAIPFFDALRSGELRFQHCARCRRLHHPPQVMCSQCSSFDFTWELSPGRGIVHSYIVIRQAIHPSLVDHVPYAVAQIQVDDGPLVTSNIVDVPPEEIEIGMPVEVVFEQVGDDVTLPLFRRAT